MVCLPVPPAITEGNWLCCHCGNVNFYSCCKRCGVGRRHPPSVATLPKRGPNHWDCPTCKNVVFPVRRVCPLCWALKPGTTPSEILYIRKVYVFNTNNTNVPPPVSTENLPIRVGPAPTPHTATTCAHHCVQPKMLPRPVAPPTESVMQSSLRYQDSFPSHGSMGSLSDSSSVGLSDESASIHSASSEQEEEQDLLVNALFNALVSSD